MAPEPFLTEKEPVWWGYLKAFWWRCSAEVTKLLHSQVTILLSLPDYRCLIWYTIPERNKTTTTNEQQLHVHCISCVNYKFVLNTLLFDEFFLVIYVKLPCFFIDCRHQRKVLKELAVS